MTYIFSLKTDKIYITVSSIQTVLSVKYELGIKQQSSLSEAKHYGRKTSFY